ncbi:MAG: hypothetical protein DRJ65_12820 [Acidobacteria bacterium]|nr:MAG: hypothetical protein DRJ65_12820 [Acidobacteriota bacterium]
MSNSRLLEYRAGPTARRLIQDRGLTPSLIRTFVAPASGPKWLVLAGLDRAMMDSDLLGRQSGNERRVLLVGASAGGWRVMAMASSDPVRVHRLLQERYVNQVFRRGVKPSEVTAAYRRMLNEVFIEAERTAIVESTRFDVAVHVTLARGAAGSRQRWLQALAMVAAAGCNVLTAKSMMLFFKRILFHSRPQDWELPFEGTVVKLDQGNLSEVALATGSVPLYFDPVADIAEAPPGHCIDGGMRDYHLNQKYVDSDDGIVVFPHFQRRIVPHWFDRYTSHRVPAADMTDNVLQIHPSEAFVQSLPGGRIPTRDDFKIFVDDSQERIRRWNQVIDAGQRLGDQLIEDIERGCIPDLIELF